MNNEERIKRFNSMSRSERQELILKKMKLKEQKKEAEFLIKNMILKSFMN